jgi:PAS domain S-box-containing protein
MTGCARMLDENKTREQLIDELHQARRTADEFKALNESINETASLYRQVVDKTDEAVFVIQEGWIKFANEMALKMTGYSKEDVSASAAISAFVHPDDQETLAQYHERRLNGAEPNYKLPFRFVRKDGTVGWAEINSSLIMWEGRPAALCLMAGITGRKKAEQALQESRDIFKVIIDSLPVGMLYVDSHERIVFANNTFRSWWRIPDSDLSGHTLEDTLGNHYPIIKSTVKAVLAGQEMTYQRPVK